jgi:hypothetical protein
MSDLRSDGSLLSSLHDFHTPYNDEISEISSSSSSSSSTNDEEKTRHIHQPRTGENFENVYQKQQPVMRIKQEEIIDQASPSRLRAQRNIKKSIATEQVHSAAPSTFLSFVVLRFLFFGFLYLLAGTIFYIYHEDWSLLTSLYFIFLSGPPPPPYPPPLCLSHDRIVCRIGLKDVAPQNGGRQPHTHTLSLLFPVHLSTGAQLFTAIYIPPGVICLWAIPLRSLFLWTRDNIDQFLLPFLNFLSIPHHRLSPEVYPAVCLAPHSPSYPPPRDSE